MTDFNVDLHLSVTPEDDAFARLTEIEVKLMHWFESTGEGAFTGNDMGEGTIVLHFEVMKPIKFLLYTRRLLATYALEKKARATVFTDLETDRQSTSLEDEAGVRSLKIVHTAKSAHRPEIGDYYAVPLPDGRFGYALYLVKEPGYGDYIQALDVISEDVEDLIVVKAALPRFAPLWTDVPSSARAGNWRFVGNAPVFSFEFPLYRSSMTVQATRKPGTYEDWSIRDLNRNRVTRVNRLSEEQRRLEVFRIWSAEEIALRLLTGINPDEGFL